MPPRLSHPLPATSQSLSQRLSRQSSRAYPTRWSSSLSLGCAPGCGRSPAFATTCTKRTLRQAGLWRTTASCASLWSGTAVTTSSRSLYSSSRSSSPSSTGSLTGSGPTTPFRLPSDYVPPTQPLSARSPDVRKSQLLRAYTSTLRSTPLILVFQHSNLTAVEWSAVRRELNLALARVPPPTAAAPGLEPPVDITNSIALQVIKSSIFKVALRVVEFFDPSSVATPDGTGKTYTHDLSEAAYAATSKRALVKMDIPDSSTYKQLTPLLVGPLAILKFPAISPAHLSAALSILAPSPPTFPPPPRRVSAGYYEPVFQNAVKKLLLVGGRIESKVFDVDGVKWVGTIDGGLDGLRAQLVTLLQSAGMGLTSTLEGAGKSLWLTMESRRSVLGEQEKGATEKKGEEDA